MLTQLDRINVHLAQQVVTVPSATVISTIKLLIVPVVGTTLVMPPHVPHVLSATIALLNQAIL
jgi:hypothetical protein